MTGPTARIMPTPPRAAAWENLTVGAPVVEGIVTTFHHPSIFIAILSKSTGGP
jgi:hypothetical protein